jgi:cytochrome P450 family 628
MIGNAANCLATFNYLHGFLDRQACHITLLLPGQECGPTLWIGRLFFSYCQPLCDPFNNLFSINLYTKRQKMSLMFPSSPEFYSAATGVTAHVLLFRYGEWDSSAPSIMLSYLAIFTVLNATNLGELVTGAKNLNAFQLLACHFLGLYGSIVIYRAFFHRLRKFPGPFVAGVTALYASFLPARKLNKFEEVGKLHRKYGDYMRLGPRELSVADPRAVPFIYGPASKTTKGPFYDGGEPYISVHTTRSKLEHARRRKAWDRAFSFKCMYVSFDLKSFPITKNEFGLNNEYLALRNYEQRVSRYSAQLLSVIAENVSRPINMARWFNYYSFDVMGDLTFGKSFEMLITGKDAYMLENLHNDMQSMGPFLHAMWIIPLFKVVPILNKSYLTYFKWLNVQVDNRTKVFLFH